MIFNLECIICIRNYKDMIHIKLDYKIILQCIFNFANEVNLVYPIHTGLIMGNRSYNYELIP